MRSEARPGGPFDSGAKAAARLAGFAVALFLATTFVWAQSIDLGRVGEWSIANEAGASAITFTATLDADPASGAAAQLVLSCARGATRDTHGRIDTPDDPLGANARFLLSIDGGADAPVDWQVTGGGKTIEIPRASSFIGQVRASQTITVHAKHDRGFWSRSFAIGGPAAFAKLDTLCGP